MLVTSLKTDGRDPPRATSSPAVRAHARALASTAWTAALHRRRLRGHPRRLLELGADRDAQHHLCRSCSARSTATRCRSGGRAAPMLLFAHADGGRLHPGAGDDVPAGADAGALGLFGSLPGIVLVHIIFSMPVMTLLFRNYYAVDPAGTVQGRAHRRRRLLAHLRAADAADVARRSSSSPPSCRSPGVWNDYILGLVFAGPRQPADDGAAQQRDQHHHRRRACTTSTWRPRS